MTTPTGSNGIDVSNHNGLLNLSEFTNLDFVIAKCTEGTSFPDNTFDYYRTVSRSHNINFGAYHFLHAENQNGEEEALYFLDHYMPTTGESIWIDYETYGFDAQADKETVELFADTIKRKFPHQKVGLYANRTGMYRILPLIKPAITPLDAYWYAVPNNQLETPGAGMPTGYVWNIHQYETFAGVDRDFSRWTKDEMRAFFS